MLATNKRASDWSHRAVKTVGALTQRYIGDRVRRDCISTAAGDVMIDLIPPQKSPCYGNIPSPDFPTVSLRGLSLGIGNQCNVHGCVSSLSLIRNV
jgi:hypothetical protein